MAVTWTHSSLVQKPYAKSQDYVAYQITMQLHCVPSQWQVEAHISKRQSAKDLEIPNLYTVKSLINTFMSFNNIKQQSPTTVQRAIEAHIPSSYTQNLRLQLSPKY
jgi:hypothetical protein